MLTDESIREESYAVDPGRSTVPPRIGVLGMGRAGLALAAEIQSSALPLVGGWNRTPRPRPSWLEQEQWTTGGELPPRTLLEACDILLLAVLDSEIPRFAAQLRPRAGCVVLHVSGSLTSAVLTGMGDDIEVGGYHPLQSFRVSSKPALVVPPYCVAVEGSETAVAAATELALATGHPAVTIDPGGKAAYHAAAVLASNCLVALQETAARVMGLAGVPGTDRWRLLWPLVVGTLANLEDGDFEGSITGPVPRGDADTVARNLAAIASDSPASDVYRVLGREALALAEAGELLSAERASAVAAALGGAGPDS